MDLNFKQALAWASVCTVAGTLLLSSASLKAEPQLSGNSNSPYCQDALLLAKSVFSSGTPRLYAVTTIPANFQSELVLGALSLELPGRGALQFNSQLFTQANHLYWQQKAANAKRLVLTETAMGWQGERYALFQLSAELSPAAFVAKGGNTDNIDKQSLLLDESWRPPLVFQHQQTGDFWFINVGEPYHLLGGWQVYSPAASGYQQSCSIKFSNDSQKPHAPLPEPVQQLIVLLDQTLGFPENEGTLQPTVRNRLMASHFWANAALRPWAISAKDSYNNKQQVDAGLLDWSLLNKKNLHIYQQIQSLLPVAQQALADYYQGRFALDHKAATELASWVLEIGYCVNFTFSGGGGYHNAAEPDPNPWQKFNN